MIYNAEYTFRGAGLATLHFVGQDRNEYLVGNAVKGRNVGKLRQTTTDPEEGGILPYQLLCTAKSR